MPPAPAPALIAELARVLRAHAPAARAITAEWSQVATAHAGRIYLDGERSPLPATATDIFHRLREQMRDEEHGAWFSARISLPPAPGGEPDFEANYSERVYWNSSTLLSAPTGLDPVPTDADWAAELRRHPRAPHRVPEWLAVPDPRTDEFSSLRAALERIGLPLPAVRLPGEEHPTFEGALLVRRLESVFSVDIFDYGQLHHLGTATTERQAGLLAWNYLSAPLPAPMAATTAEVTARAQAAQAGYHDLRARITAAGVGGVVTNLAPGVPFDRWGGLDGLYLWAWDTAIEQRSLPPSATSGGAVRVGFVANQPVAVQAEFTPPWFDQPGGGIRFRMQQPLRDLVRSGEMAVVEIVDPGVGTEWG